MIILSWKEFDVNLERMHLNLTRNLPNYDGMVADSIELKIMFHTTESQLDIDYVNSYWSSITSQTESTPNAEEQLEYVKTIIKNAVQFGQDLIITFAAENVSQGITQAGKTRAVATYLANIQVLLNGGSLYGALDEIDDLVTAGIPSDLSPFITEQRLLNYKEIIEEYLGL
jgi:6-pyruvoyl-tetrahydropterin synthase